MTSIPSTPDELLDRAARAEATGQPNLAALYLKRAEQLAEEQRRDELGPGGRAMEDITNAVREIAQVFSESFGYSKKGVGRL